MNRLAVKRPKMIELNDEENVLRPPAKFAEVGVCLQDHQPIVYRAEAPRLCFVDRSSVKKRQALSPMMMT